MADPVAEFVRMTRGALTAAGFERKALDGTVYFEGGNGPPLVLIHGVNDHAGTWAAVAGALSQTHRVIIPDLPGHGESEPATGPISLGFIIERLHAIVPPDATLVGNSMGGWVAFLYALQYPVRRLVLEAGGGLNQALAVPLIATTRDDAKLILRAVHGKAAAYLPEWATDAVLARAVSAPLLRMTGLDGHYIDERLADVQVPVTLIWGSDDGVVPRSYMERMRDGIPGAKMLVIEGAAHIPHAQQPERFLQCLTETF